jgi:hypothetical protein
LINELPPDASEFAKAMRDTFKPTLKQDKNGSYQPASIKESLKGSLKGVFGGIGGKIGVEINKAINGQNIGKAIADGFLKSTGALAENIGLDKVIKGMADGIKPGLTYKGGVFEDKKSEGDALQRDIAKEQSSKIDSQTEILKDVLKEIKNVATNTNNMSRTYRKP